MSIRELREAVEVGIATGGPADALVVPKAMGDLIASVLGDDDELWSDFVEAHDGSLDAAKRLHDALLPGWRVEAFNLDGEVVLRRDRPMDRAYGDALNSGEVARAWLLALLRALEQEGRDG